MQSNLKKSLYLGLAALSFASVASVTANSSNANAAKKHAAAKKLTYKTTNKNLDQSVTFKSTGKNAVYNKAVGKRSVVASLSDMKSKANSNSTKDLFMAYQEGVTSKGVHYYKVVSFDKKVRGFVYNKGVAKTNTTVAANKPANATGYLTQTNRFFNKAYGSQFKTSLKNDYNGMNIAADQFTVSDAVKVNNDQTYYYVTDKNNQLINGWVNSVYFSNNVTPAAQKAVDSANAVNVTFVSKDKLGSTLFTKSVNPKMNTNGTYNNSDVVNAVNDALKGNGYANVDNTNITNNSDNKSLDATGTTSKGANLTVVATPETNKQPVSYVVNGLKDKGTYGQSTVSISNDDLNAVNLDNNVYNSLFMGTHNSAFNYSNFKSQLLDSGKAMNVLTTKDGKTTLTFDAAATESNAANPALFDSNNNLKSNATFGEVAAQNGGKGLNLVYDVKTSATTSTPANNNTTNIFASSAASSSANSSSANSSSANSSSANSSSANSSSANSSSANSSSANSSSANSSSANSSSANSSSANK